MSLFFSATFTGTNQKANAKADVPTDPEADDSASCGTGYPNLCSCYEVSYGDTYPKSHTGETTSFTFNCIFSTHHRCLLTHLVHVLFMALHIFSAMSLFVTSAVGVAYNTIAEQKANQISGGRRSAARLSN